MAIHANREKVQTAIANRAPFKNGRSFTGEAGTTFNTGMMHSETRKPFLDDMSSADTNGADAYVVASYGTPIGWWVEGLGWTIPDAKYSNTTTNHQHHLRMGAR